MPEVIKVEEKFKMFSEHWSPKIVAELNGQHVKLARLKGEFVWHKHEDEDELFYVVNGTLQIAFRDATKTINSGEMIVIPKGVEHKPIAQDEVMVMLFEPASTINTGNVEDSLTVNSPDWI